MAVILWTEIHTNNVIEVIEDNWSTGILHETNFANYMGYDKFLLIHKCIKILAALYSI